MRCAAGEGVVITRRGQPVVELKPVPAAPAKPKRVTEADLEWLRACVDFLVQRDA